MSFNFGSGGESTGFSFGGGDSTSGGGTATFSFGGGDSKKEEKKTETESSLATFSFGGTDEKKTDSSTTSFSFGGGNDAVSFGSGKKTHALEDDKKESSKKKGLTLDLGNSETKSETGGSFSFGGTTEEKKTETSSLGGGFGFGVTSSDSTETKKETNFSFSGTSSDQKKEENSTSVEPKGILSKPTSEMFNLKNKTVEDIINKWNIELEEDVSLFTKLAIQAAKWDKELLTNEEKVKKKKKNFYLQIE